MLNKNKLKTKLYLKRFLFLQLWILTCLLVNPTVTVNFTFRLLLNFDISDTGHWGVKTKKV